MENSLEEKIELFVKNSQDIKKEFRWQNEMIKRVAALLYASEGKSIDTFAIHNTIKLIKQNTGMLSPFRNTSLLITATMLSLNDDSKELLNRTIEVYKMMKNSHFKSSDFLVIAACQIASNCSPDQYQNVIKRAQVFYELMKRHHRFLTGQNDYIFAVLLGLSDVEINFAEDRMEQLYTSLQPRFRSRYGVKGLTQVLILAKNQENIEMRVTSLYDDFFNSGLKMDKAYALSSLGVLTLLPEQTDRIMDKVFETSELLRSKKGFGFWSSVSKQELSLLAASLVTIDSLASIDQSVLDTTLSTSIINIVIAQQTTAATAAMAATIASTSANSTN